MTDTEGDRGAGIVIGKVTRVRDDRGLARVEVEYPWLGQGEPVRRPVSVAAPMGGSDTGICFMPEVGAECLLAFDQGRWDHPYIIGFLWNPQQPPPASDERIRIIRSKNGHTILMVDSTEVAGDKGALIIRDGHGHTISMTNGQVVIHSKGSLDIRADGQLKLQGRLVRKPGREI